MEFNCREIEKKWQLYWQKNNTYKVDIDKNKEKYYVLEMFPYPSGAGLHVGHPLGYVAGDIYARYKRLKGYNVLHPMGFDAFGLPAEQYAIETGQHPAKTTAANIKTYKKQLDNIGFSYDWSREVITSDPQYYKWTQWIFMQLFDSWYDQKENKAKPISELIKQFEQSGNKDINGATHFPMPFEANQWNNIWDERERQSILMNYRLAYQTNADVNWCPALGTVLANDEVKDGISERGGHPVEKKSMRQWFLRITAYAQRLLDNLEDLDWSNSLKEMQKNWIGRSEGASLNFKTEDNNYSIEVFTTRPDTIYGCTFMVLAPEHDLVEKISTNEYKTKVDAYIAYAKKRTERDRQAETKKITGQFTGAYAINPFNNKKVAIYIADYVLAGYGTGAIMAVPAHDERDYAFAKHFDLDIIEVISGGDISKEAYSSKDGKLVNSDFLNGLKAIDAIPKAIEQIESKDLGSRKINYKLRDAAFSRQRYWGEPFPIYYKEGIPYLMKEADLPLELPEIDSYTPTESGEAPLARAKNWGTKEGYPIETDTMPGYAGSSWYFLRYMDPNNTADFASKETLSYWNQVDLYIGGTEHATGHLLYARFWTQFLKDCGYLSFEEPFKKMVNQGMIQGQSVFITKAKIQNINNKDDVKTILSHDAQKYINGYKILEKSHHRIPLVLTYKEGENFKINAKNLLQIISKDLRFQEFKNKEDLIVWDPNSEKTITLNHEVEKMSKSKFNVINPDEVIDKYGADVFRMYEMFLGPIEMHKPWDTKGIDGISRFLKKFWHLFFNNEGNFSIDESNATDEELKILHKTIKKITEDIERMSFNTAISAMMVCTNELGTRNSNKRAILEPFLICLAPFAPYITEELWELLGNKNSITQADFPQFDESYLKEDNFEYPVSINGKMRTKITFPIDQPKEAIEQQIRSSDELDKWLSGSSIKKVIVVPGRIINIVI